jgi:hypothetical protein
LLILFDKNCLSGIKILVNMDDTAFIELDLIMRFIKTVKDKKTNLVKIHTLGTDSDGLTKMMINVNEVPCLPPWPNPRLFQCPGVKQVKWCPSPTQPHYLILGNPEAVIVVIQKRLLKKANKMLQQILLQLDNTEETLNWRSLVTPSPPSIMPPSPLPFYSAMSTEYIDPASTTSDASMVAVSPVAIFSQPVHGMRNSATPTPTTQAITDTGSQAVVSSGVDSSAAMPTLTRQDQPKTSSGEYWRWDM